MTLNETIKNYEEMIKEEEWKVKVYESAGYPITAEEFQESIKEHKQLIEWLKELKSLRGEN